MSGAAPDAAIREGWIASIAPEDATGELADAYQVQLDKIGHVTALTQLGSLYPQIVAERLRLYELVESAPSAIPDWGRRAAALLTSVLNGCKFCTVGHTERLSATGHADLAEQIKLNPDTVSSGDASVNALLVYVRKLVRTPGQVSEADIDALRTVGWSDLDILDVNNLSAYYSYINRVATGLGLTREA